MAEKNSEYSNTVESLTEELILSYEEINLLYDLDDLLTGAMRPEDAIDTILGEASNIVRAGWGVAFLADENDGSVELLKECGSISAEQRVMEMELVREHIDEFRVTRRGVIMNDPSDGDSGFCLSAKKSVLKVPLCTKEDVIGVICLGDKEGEDGFTSMDLKLLTALAARAATAVENNRLLAHYLEKQRLDQELTLARSIQEGLLPKVCPDIAGYNIAAYGRVCAGVGGDYYDFISLDGGKLAVVMGDVSGHGIGAALIMSSMRSALRALAGEGASALVERLNRIMVEDSADKGMMMTLFYGVLEPEGGKLTYTNAGHDYPFIVRENGEVELLRSTGSLLGIFEDTSFREGHTSLEVGDVFVLYTDGITEAENGVKEQLGRERLIDVVRRFRRSTAKDIVKRVIEYMEGFSEGPSVDDDTTLVVIGVGK